MQKNESLAVGPWDSSDETVQSHRAVGILGSNPEEGHRLMRSFLRIKEAAVREAIVQLVTELSTHGIELNSDAGSSAPSRTRGDAERQAIPRSKSLSCRHALVPAIPREPRKPRSIFTGAEVGEMQRVGFADIRDVNCRWPLGDPLSEDFAYCGLQPAPGRSYCAGHCRMAYQPSKAGPRDGWRESLGRPRTRCVPSSNSSKR